MKTASTTAYGTQPSVLSNPQQTLMPTVDRQFLRVHERRLTIALSVLAFFVSYVITAGPAVFLVERFKFPVYESIVRWLYAPLVVVVKANVPILSPLINAWVDLFR